MTRHTTLTKLALASALVAVALSGAACSSSSSSGTSTPATNPPATQGTDLSSAITAAGQSVSSASTTISTLKQPLDDATMTKIQTLQSTLNLAETQTGAAQVATAQKALEQFDDGIAAVEAVIAATPADSPDTDSLNLLLQDLQNGRDQLAAGLPK